MKKIGYLLILVSFFSKGQSDTVYSINNKQIKESLREGTNQYLVFIQNKKKVKQTGAYIWSRTIKFKKFNSKDVIEISQKWYSSDSARYRYVYSLVERNTLLPIYHRTWTKQLGIEAYDFYPDKIVGSDSVSENSKKGFSITLSHPSLNWEIDLETFGLLQLKPNKSFAINFYHPGAKGGPGFYEYKVVGDEVLTGSDGVKVPCWKLKINYSEKSWAVFYISKKKKEVVKMEEDFGVGVRYKVKLPSSITVL